MQPRDTTAPTIPLTCKLPRSHTHVLFSHSNAPHQSAWHSELRTWCCRCVCHGLTIYEPCDSIAPSAMLTSNAPPLHTHVFLPPLQAAPFPHNMCTTKVPLLSLRVGCFQFPDWCFPFPWCFLFPDWCFRFPWCFWFPGLGVSSSWIGVFLAQLLCWCFWFPGLGVFSPGQCVPCPAPVLVCPFTCLFVSFRLNFWLPLPTAGFESTYSCHTIKQTKNTAKPSKPFAGKHVSLRKPTAAKTQGTR